MTPEEKRATEFIRCAVTHQARDQVDKIIISGLPRSSLLGLLFTIVHGLGIDEDKAVDRLSTSYRSKTSQDLDKDVVACIRRSGI